MKLQCSSSQSIQAYCVILTLVCVLLISLQMYLHSTTEQLSSPWPWRSGAAITANRKLQFSKYHNHTEYANDNMTTARLNTKFIVYSLYGHLSCYIFGALRSVVIAQELMPDWDILLYVHSAVLTQHQGMNQQQIQAIAELQQLSNVRLIEVNDTAFGMFWRFQPFFDATLPPNNTYLSRDTDSMLSLREKHAIDEWLASDRDIYTIRDHPEHHVPFLGGMFGARNQALVPFADVFQRYYHTAGLRRGGDQQCLKQIYAKLNPATDIYVHTNYRTMVFPHESPHQLLPITDPIKNPGQDFVGRIDCFNWTAINRKYGWNLTEFDRKTE